jgi:hypothetical protein
MRVNLTKEELEICRTLGMKRHECARQNNVSDQQMGDQDPWQIDIDGVVGELCVAKLLNLYPDLSVSPRAGGWDLLSKGQTIDVKSTRYTTGQLLATLKKSHAPCDIYVLAIVDDRGATIVGWEYGNILFQPTNLTDLGWGQGYALPQDRLKKFSEQNLKRRNDNAFTTTNSPTIRATA